MSNILKTIKERRSVRQYQNKTISAEIIKEIKEALVWAPSAANLQARKFYFVSNQEIKNKIAENASAKNKMIMSQAPLIIVACANRRQPDICY